MSEQVVLLVIGGRNAGGTLVNFRFATKDYLTPAPTPDFYEGRLKQPALTRRDMYSQGRTMGEIQIASGAIVLENADGKLDYLRNYSFDGNSFLTTYLGGFNTSSGFVEQPTFDDDRVVFQVRDVRHTFDIQLQPAKYSGSNSLPAGITGTASDIKGQPLPILYGTVRNVPPVCVNTSRQIYQLNDVNRGGFKTGYTLAVYDKRSALTRGADYTSQADMEANAPTAGQYRVWPAWAMFRTNAAHTLLTCDVFNPHQASGTDDIDDVIYQLIYDRFGTFPFTAWSAYLAATPGVGIYAQDERTLLQVLQEVAVSVQSFLAVGGAPDGGGTLSGNDLWLSHLCDPASLPYTPAFPIIDLDQTSILSGSLKSTVPAEGTRGLPVWRINLRYAKNYRVMSATDLAGVALSELAIWSQEYLTVTAEDSAVKTQWPNAPELTVTTLLADVTEAQAEADRLLALFKVQRQMFTLQIARDTVPFDPLGVFNGLFQIGVRVRITFPRHGLDAGKLFLITGILENQEQGTYELTVWG